MALALVQIEQVSGAILPNHGVDIGTLGTGPQGSVPNLRDSPAGLGVPAPAH